MSEAAEMPGVAADFHHNASVGGEEQAGASARSSSGTGTPVRSSAGAHVEAARVVPDSSGSGHSGGGGDSGYVFVDSNDGKSPTGAAGQGASDTKSWRTWNPFSRSGSSKDKDGKEESKASAFKRSFSSKVPFFKSKEKEAEKKEKKQLTPELGAHVRVFGLVNASRYNDCHGVIREVLDEGERFVVILDSHEAKQISVKLTNIEVTKLPDKQRADGEGAGAMLKIAASRIIKPKTGSSNYYDDLGIAPTATAKEIKDAYYSMAKQCHPDKNKQDPEAEVKFKRISEAYQVLSDPEKRKIYDEQGESGLEEFNLDHFKAFATTLFGGGEFEDVFGDVCELPVFKELLSTIVDSQGGTVEVDTATRAANLKRYTAQEEEYVKLIAERLARRVAGRADGEESKAAFETRARAWAAELCQAPGGMDLVEAAGNVWRRKARKIMGGFGGVLQEMKDLKNKVAEGSSLLYGAIKCSAMASSLSKSVEPKTKEGKGALGAGEESKTIKDRAEKQSVGQTPAAAGGGESAAAGATGGGGAEEAEGGGKEEEEEEEEEEMGDVDPEEVRKFARHSIDLVWRIGLFLLQKRMRQVVDRVVANEKGAAEAAARAAESDAKKAAAAAKRRYKARAGAVAGALLELGEAFRAEWQQQGKGMEAGERTARGAPLHLADDLASQVAQAKESREGKAAAEGGVV